MSSANIGINAASMATNGLMTVVHNIIKNNGSPSSLVDIARPARVEPIVLVDKVLVNQPYMVDVMKYATSTVAGYYLQAVNMLLGVGRIDTLKVFDALNPNRALGPGIGGALVSKEAYALGLPALESFNQKIPANLIARASNESDSPTGNGMSADVSNARLTEIDSLSVGKLINVEVREGKDKAKIPVLIRLVPVEAPSDTLVQIMSAGGRESWAHRWFLVNSGQIRFWKDFVFGQDLIDEHMKALMNDKSGIYKAITDRRRNNFAKSVTTGQVSLADASNIAIVSSETLKATTNKLYGNIDDPAVRQKIFDNSYLMMLVVVNERYERVTIYHRGLDLATTYRYDELKAQEKKGNEIGELFKMFSRQMQTNI